MKIGHRRSVRRLIGAAAAVTVASIAVTACGGSDEDSGPAAGGGKSKAPVSQAAVDAALKKGGTITYWTWTPAEAQVKAFMKQYPNVKVKLVNAGTGNDHYAKLQNAIRAGSGAPDVAQIEYFALPQFARHLIDLRQYGFEKFAPDYTPSSWEISHVGEGLYGLPQGPGQMALFYNKKVFDKHGIAVPKTWDEYVEAARQLKQADPKKYITADTGDAGFLMGLIWQAGGRPFQVEGQKVNIDLTDEGTQKFTSKWNQLLKEGHLAPFPHWTEEWFKGLADGTIATVPFGNWMGGVIDGMGKKAKDSWRAAPMPTYDGGQPVSAQHGGSAESVIKQSKNPALAAAFLRWLNHEEGNKLYIETGGYPDSLADIRDPAFLDKPYKAFGEQKINRLFDEIAGTVGKGWEFLPYQVHANTIFGDTVGKTYRTKSDINSGLERWQDALVKYGKQQGFQVEGK